MYTLQAMLCSIKIGVFSTILGYETLFRTSLWHMTYSNFWITGFVSFKCSHVNNINRIGVSEASKCRGINYLSYCVTFLYLRLTNLNKKGYQTMSRNFLVALIFRALSASQKYMVCCNLTKMLWITLIRLWNGANLSIHWTCNAVCSQYTTQDQRCFEYPSRHTLCFVNQF